MTEHQPTKTSRTISIAAGDIHDIVFQPKDMLHLRSVDYWQDNDIVLHVQPRLAAGQIVINDRRGGQWGAPLRLPLQDLAADAPFGMRLRFGADGVGIRLGQDPSEAAVFPRCIGLIGACELHHGGAILARNNPRLDVAYRGTIEAIRYGRGFIMVDGWLVVPRDHPWPEQVTVRTGTDSFTLTHWFARRDLPADPAGPLFLAFRQDFPWSRDAAPDQTLALYVLDQLAPVAKLEPARWAPYEPIGAIEAASQAEISGWVYDPSLWHRGGRAEVTLNGLATFPITFTLDRPDLTGAPLAGRKLGFKILAAEIGEALAKWQALLPDALCEAVLYSDGRILARQEMSLQPLSHGRLEGSHGGAVRGWVALKDHPYAVPAVELLIDGVVFGKLRASSNRRDLLRKGITTGAGGFNFPLQLSPSDKQAVVVEARVAGEARLLAGSPLTVEGLVPQPAVGAAPWRNLARGRPAVSIVIPVYNAAAELAACLAAVTANTTGKAELIVIDDASPDPEVAKVLEPYRGRPGIRVEVNATNLGFTATANRGIALAGRNDVVLLNSDTLPPARWLESLITAAYSSPRTASASPLSDHAGAFSAPDMGIGRNPLPPNLGISDVARLVAQGSPGIYPDVPTGHGFCLYIRRAALDEVGPLDVEAFPRGYGEENDFCMRALRAGWRHVIDDRGYVQHRQSASFGDTKATLLPQGRAVLDQRFPEYTALVRAFVDDERMLGVRWRVRRAFAKANVTPPRPRVLYVISTESGGTPQTNLDLMRSLADRYEPWLLRSDSRSLALWQLVDGELKAVDQYTLAAPLQMSIHRSETYNEVVAAWLHRNAIEIVHIRHIAWHGLDLPAIAQALGLPVMFSLHDFYVVCPTIKLLDGVMRHCAGRCAEGSGDCRAELWPAEEVPPLRNRFIHRWRAMMSEGMQSIDAFVVTSEQARRLILDAFPTLPAERLRMVPHGRSFERFLPAASPADRDGPLRVLVPGNISPAKGALLIDAMAELDLGHSVEFHILGDAGWLREKPGLVLHGRYRREDFLEHVERIRADVGAVLSIWPETYCHTLTELWAAGLPVVAIDLGAPGERIRAHGGGWLLPLLGPDALLTAIVAIGRDHMERQARLEEVTVWQRGEGMTRDIHSMAEDYHRLYGEVQAQRMTFITTQTKSEIV